jgi:D-glycero-D-manno-heptose 1,7-bisphosphate phosphatase
LDRDGTLIMDKGYICDFTQVQVFDFTFAAVRAMNEAGYLVIVVSNQSAVARGICSEKQILRLHRELKVHFKKNQARIDAIYFCPYLATGTVAPYRRESPLRKPAPGMLLQAAHNFNLDLPSCIMIGDKGDDIQAGQNAGCLTILVRTGQGLISEAALPQKTCHPDHIVDDLLAASEIVKALSVHQKI